MTAVSISVEKFGNLQQLFVLYEKQSSTLLTMHLPLAFSSYLSFFLTEEQQHHISKQKTRTNRENGFLNENNSSACRYGTLKNQPNNMGMTPQYFHNIPTPPTPPTPCAILPTM